MRRYDMHVPRELGAAGRQRRRNVGKFSAIALLAKRRTAAARRRRPLLAAAVGAMATLLLFVIPLVRSLRPATIPVELVGTWVSADPRYAGRALQLDAGGVTFHAGSEVLVPHPLRGVRAFTVDGGRRYQIDYAAGGRRARIGLRVSALGELRLDHPRDVVWYRPPPAPSTN